VRARDLPAERDDQAAPVARTAFDPTAKKHLRRYAQHANHLRGSLSQAPRGHQMPGALERSSSPAGETRAADD